MKLYLAGPEVFLPDAVEIGKTKRELCRQRGFVGLFPLDNEPATKPTITPSKSIFDSNITMLNDADAIVANLTPFRGVSADVGTVFEVGYGFACGKKVYGYSNVRTGYIDRIQKFISGPRELGVDGRLYATDGLAVEGFGHFDNLMIAESLLASGENIVLPAADVRNLWQDMETFDKCLRIIRARNS
jgi:nucleoside 2-deoxyribosyltransferase